MTFHNPTSSLRYNLQGDDAWFDALWEIMVTVVGGVLATVGGAIFLRWFRREHVHEEPMPSSRGEFISCDWLVD